MISTILPTHNRHEDLQRAIHSVFNQSVLPDELIVVDDGSTTPVLEKVFKDCPPSIKWQLLRNDTPCGGNFSRNRGVIASSNEWIAFLDDDDEFMPQKIEEATFAIQANPDVDVFYHPARINMVNERCFYYSQPESPDAHQDFFRAMLIKNRIGGTSMVICKKKALLSVGLFDESLPALQDYELWLRLAKSGCRFKLLLKPLTNYNYTTKQGSVSKSITRNERAIDLIEKKYADDCKTLSTSEKKMHAAWKIGMIIHKLLLNGQTRSAFYFQMKQFLNTPHPRYLLQAFLLIFGNRSVFKIKSFFGKNHCCPK